jgi:hypothetical protein
MARAAGRVTIERRVIEVNRPIWSQPLRSPLSETTNFLAPAKTVTVCSQLRFGQSCDFHPISARASLNRIAVMGVLD